LLLCLVQIIFQLSYNVNVRAGDRLVVVFDVGVLLLVLLSKHTDCFILFAFNALNLCFTSLFHILSQKQHLVLKSDLDLLTNAFVFFADISILLIVSFCQGIKVLLMSDLLFLLSNFKTSYVLFKFALSDTVFILNVF